MKFLAGIIVDKRRTGLETREIAQYVIVLEIFDHMTKKHPSHSCNMADCKFKTRHGKLCFNGCHTNRANKSGKYDNISIFKITARSGRFYLDWKRDILNKITKYRQVDPDLSQQIERGQIYIS